jgi:TIR domain-containing protein
MPDPVSDVFLSYAHADDEVPAGAAKGWVTTLADELRKVLRRKLGGRGAGVFMDHQLAANEGVTSNLRTSLRDSRTLVLVMSPGYQRSQWCQWELARFLEEEASRKSRDGVFIVETDPTERGGWPRSLQELVPIRFWEREFEDRAPRLLGFPTPKPDEDSRYWRNVNELAHLIAERLTASVAPAAAPRPAVWLAECTEDLLEERDTVAAALRQQGYEVIPAAPYPRDGAVSYLEALQRDLDRAALFVQLFGPREGHRPAWGDASLVALQAAAAAATTEARGVEICQWRARETDPFAVASSSYRGLLLGVQVLAGRIEEFVQGILQRLARARTTAPNARVLSPSGFATSASSQHPTYRASQDLFVYVNADPVDRDLALRVQDTLSDLGVSSALAPAPSLEVSPEQTRRAQQEQLEASDAVVLVYGHAPLTWVHSQFAFARRTLAQQQRPLRAALVDGPPPEKQDLGLRGPGILALSCRSGFDAGLLGLFVQGLRAGAAHA